MELVIIREQDEQCSCQVETLGVLPPRLEATHTASAQNAPACQILCLKVPERRCSYKIRASSAGPRQFHATSLCTMTALHEVHVRRALLLPTTCPDNPPMLSDSAQSQPGRPTGGATAGRFVSSKTPGRKQHAMQRAMPAALCHILWSGHLVPTSAGGALGHEEES